MGFDSAIELEKLHESQEEIGHIYEGHTITPMERLGIEKVHRNRVGQKLEKPAVAKASVEQDRWKHVDFHLYVPKRDLWIPVDFSLSTKIEHHDEKRAREKEKGIAFLHIRKYTIDDALKGSEKALKEFDKAVVDLAKTYDPKPLLEPRYPTTTIQPSTQPVPA